MGGWLVEGRSLNYVGNICMTNFSSTIRGAFALIRNEERQRKTAIIPYLPDLNKICIRLPCEMPHPREL